jgi:hypothetical protein
MTASASGFRISGFEGGRQPLCFRHPIYTEIVVEHGRALGLLEQYLVRALQGYRQFHAPRNNSLAFHTAWTRKSSLGCVISDEWRPRTKRIRCNGSSPFSHCPW